jgi:uncharacterized protein YqgV (UPF0045/DUF77 family)
MTPAQLRLRACLHAHPQVGAVCTVRDADLRELLSTVEAMRECCQERGRALTTVIHGVVEAHICERRLA